ncbi:tRNA lysidine(34) synthetase TilS [Reyranella sp.]|uniref:tRNA lysidine(34) synthetase TilS n=1 Tax=Reyranella sp. TaxID=1929291 RepID=UPI003D09633E
MSIEGAEFAALMAPLGPFEARPVLAVAVSGGRDSLALALLAHDWAVARQGRVLALIVDHGLRPESGAEARATLGRLDRRGIAGEILQWAGTKPASGLQEAARDARYRLLFEACRRHGILHLLVAHHAGDQAETIAMRAARRSGPDGLAGMAAAVEHRDVRLLRPLLGVSRDRLTATLEARAVGWVDDPSNDDRRFERVRVRQDGSALAGAVTQPAARAARDRVLAETMLEVLDVEPDGAVALDHLRVSRLDREIAVRLLSRVVQSVGGGDYPPRRDRLERAVARLSRGAMRGKSGKSQDFTLSGCRLMLRQVPGSQRLRWIVRPESGRKSGRKPSQPLVPAVFFACGASGAPHLV